MNALATVCTLYFQEVGIAFTKTYLRQRLAYHPHGQSLASLSDTLQEYWVENMIVRIPSEQLAEVAFPVIAQVQQRPDKEADYLLLLGFQGDRIHYRSAQGDEKAMSLADFGKIWQGVLVLLAALAYAGEADYPQHRRQERLRQVEYGICFGALAVWITVGLLWSGSLWNGAILGGWLAGFTCSLVLVRRQFGKTTAFFSRLCQVTPQTDCDTVLQSPASTFLGWLSWAEVGLIYFAGGLVSTGLAFLSGQINPIFALLFLLTLLALPYTVFFLYYQARILKKWCTLCVLVQSILWINGALLFPYYPYVAVIDHRITLGLLGFLLPLAGWLLIRPLLLDVKKIPALQREAAGYYREPQLFAAFLHQQREVKPGNLSQEIIFGNPAADLTLMVVYNPFCKPCAQCHTELQQLMQYRENDLRVIFRFTADVESGSQRNQVIRHLLSLKDQAYFPRGLSDWFEEMNYEKWSVAYPPSLSSASEALVREHAQWCQSNQIVHTPTVFINGKELKEPFALPHVAYHLKDLMETRTCA